MNDDLRPRGLVGRVRHLLFADNARFLKFATIGGSGVIVNQGILWLLADVVLLGLPPDVRIPIAGVFAIGVSIFTNFLLNDLWTWGDREKLGRRHFFQRLAKYYLVASAAAGLNYGLLLLGWKVVGLHHLVANLIGIGLAMVVNFIIQNRWTFRERSRDDAPDPP